MTNRDPLVESATGRYRAAVRQSGEGWQFAILIHRPDLNAWWPVLRYLGIFPTREAAEAEARSVLTQMEDPAWVEAAGAASGRDRAIAMAVETAEKIAREASRPAAEGQVDGKHA